MVRAPASQHPRRDSNSCPTPCVLCKFSARWRGGPRTQVRTGVEGRRRHSMRPSRSPTTRRACSPASAYKSILHGLQIHSSRRLLWLVPACSALKTRPVAATRQRPHRLVVRTSRRGRDNPGSTPGVDTRPGCALVCAAAGSRGAGGVLIASAATPQSKLRVHPAFGLQAASWCNG